MNNKSTAISKMVEYIFTKFMNIYGNAWESRHRDEMDWKTTRETWADHLKEFEFEVIQKALHKVATKFPDWPPTLGQMVKLCREELGLPNQDEVLKRLIDRNLSHPLVKSCYEKIGSWALSHDSDSLLRTKLKTAYSEALDTVGTKGAAALPFSQPNPMRISRTSGDNDYKSASDLIRSLVDNKKNRAVG